MEKATFGAGCFWGVEAAFQGIKGVASTAVGYCGGSLENPTYQDVCSGTTGHAEVVQVEFDNNIVSFDDLLEVFWASHDPTTLNRQGPDIGTQYRSGIYAFDDVQMAAAKASRVTYQRALSGAGYGAITTEIVDAPAFYYAEEVHQQYLAKVPGGYCGLGGTGVSCSTGLLESA